MFIGSRSTSGVPDAALLALTSQMNEMKVSVEGLEKERDFYFNKVSSTFISFLQTCETRVLICCIVYRP